MTGQPKSKTEKLLKQYPFLTLILKAPMEPFGPDRSKAYNDLTIKVERADHDLMFRQADNIGLVDNGFFGYLKGPRASHNGKRGEYLFAIDAEGRFLHRTSWPRNREEERTMGKVYGWNVLWATKTVRGFSDPIWNKTEFLVWVTVEAFYKATGDMESPFGEFIDRTIEVTVYRKPACGYEKLNLEANVYENLYLTSTILTQAVFDKDFDLITIGGQLAELCRLFQDEVYFQGMKEILDKGDVRGASGTFGPVKVLVAEMCGYDRAMLQDDSSWVSFQLRPEAKQMYVLGMGGTLPQIRRLVKTVVSMWAKPDHRLAFKSDGKVSIV